MCLYPKRLLNPKYLPSKKNNHTPPTCTDERLRYINADCGKCYECRKKKARQWSIRMLEELRDLQEQGRGDEATFATLTFDNKHLEELKRETGIKNVKGNENIILALAMRRFLERVRKRTKKSIWHWCVTELGDDNGRMHIHGIFIHPIAKALIQLEWNYGIVDIGDYVNEKTINYIVKYMNKPDLKHKWFTGKVFCSAGIGKRFLKNTFRNKWREEDTKDDYRRENGTIVSMPDYYKRKLYTDEQREKLWIKKIEDTHTYIGGERIKKNEKDEEEIRKYWQSYHQRINFDNPEDWEEQKKINKRQRMIKGRMKAKKEALKEYRKLGQIPTWMLKDTKYEEKKHESYCRFKDYVIYLQHRKKQNSKQLKLLL